MALCRFSSDGWRCDLHIYESRDGYHCSVARHRFVLDRSALPPYPRPPRHASAQEREAWADRYLAAHRVWSSQLERAHREPIDLEYAGETLVFAKAEDLLEFVQRLKELGYLVPDWLGEALQEECL